MHNYFYNRFPEQLRQLEFRQPNSIIRKVMQDEAVVFFGGRDWNSVVDDLYRIPSKDHPKFILCLFMIVVTDQYLYRYQTNIYQTWREETKYPKFGWCGLGPHHENPFKILCAPERDSVIDIDATIYLMPSFVEFLLLDTSSFFSINLPNLNYSTYFAALKQDKAYAFNEGEIIKCFKNEFESALIG
jgi:hypothetical protein